MELSANIDWISASYPNDFESKNWQSAQLPIETKGKPIRGMNGYDIAEQYPSGAIKLSHSTHYKMGIHVVYTAKTIAKMNELYAVSQYEIMNYLMRGAKITRLDVCVDVKDYPVDIAQLFSDAKSGKVKTRAKSFGYVESADIKKDDKAYTAQTCYIGSMHKRKKLLRVYDKGQQLGLDFDLKRFELELHGALSNNAANYLKASRVEKLSENIRGMIKAYADFTDTHAASIFTSQDAIPIAHPQYRKGDTALWLIGTVAPVLARETLEDYKTFEAFMEAFKIEYERMGGNAQE